MKYILLNRATNGERIAFLKSGRAGVLSAQNPPRIYDSFLAAERHATLLRSVLGGIWEPEEAIRIAEERLAAA
jgi:hypothetical protein